MTTCTGVVVVRVCGTCGARRDLADGEVFPSHVVLGLPGARWMWCPAGDVSGVIVGIEK